MSQKIRQKEAVGMFTCGCCDEQLASNAEVLELLSKYRSDPLELMDIALRCHKDHSCPQTPPARPKLAPIRTRCFRCGEGVREGLPYMLAHLRHNYPDGRVTDSPREFHHPCFERFLKSAKGGRSKVVYQVLSNE